MPAEPLNIECRGERLVLLADRAVWWPAQRTLLVADCHFGKAATYRVLGQPVPHGTTRENLARLDALLETYDAERLVFLGDFLHGPQVHAATSETLPLLHAWRSRRPSLRCTLVRGNHDLRAGDPPSTMDIELADEPLLEGPFAFCHHPQSHATHQVFAGHIHPVCSLRGPGRDALRLPCFVLTHGMLLMPSFGEFTGGHAIEHAPGQQIYAVGGGGVWQVA